MEKMETVKCRYSAAVFGCGLVLWRSANRSTAGEDAEEASDGTVPSWRRACIEARQR